MNRTIPRAGARRAAGGRQQGFSLIELMVVVAILAILGMIALPKYQKFAAKAKMAAALQEISIGTGGLDLIYIEEGTVQRVITPEEIGLPSTSNYCVQRYLNASEFWCVLKPDSVLGPNPTIGFLRDSHNGKWRCHAGTGNGDQQLIPQQCRY
ncbi:prepilin-type N-terminal cleavage/methylation domain-containing protein [Stenotrophomonas sp. SPM]|uniref:prepilin-type N-terminal cleavage/methylation domain-containing protein n=1 Tax=Stenotrophomonas sp. SPM TaxID=2170735 RepID=UPI0024360E7B|nr:prepilin-type N-terminal cleavage/methylation domain-containing protein [Stenotrophomonas sp. SPM]